MFGVMHLEINFRGSLYSSALDIMVCLHVVKRCCVSSLIGLSYRVGCNSAQTLAKVVVLLLVNSSIFHEES